MWFLYDNIVAIMVAVVGCMFAWLYGGIVADALIPVMPWLWIILVEVMIAFPQRHYGETTYDARRRTWRKLKKDPLTWIVVGFLILLALPFINKGLCPICDYPEIVAGTRAEPPIPFFPFCVNRMHHLNVFLWFLPALTAMLAVKHSLLKRGKRVCLEMIVWNGVLLAILGFVQQVMGAETPLWADFSGERAYFFSTFGYPNMGGDYFTTLFALSIGLWRSRFDEIREAERESHDHGGHNSFWRKHTMLIPAVLFFFAALTTLSRATIMLVSLLALVFFAHTFSSLFVAMSKAKRVRACAVSLFALVAVAMLVVMFIPDNLQKEVDTINADAVLQRVSGRGQYHVRVATEIWKDAPLFGVGGWGYKHFCIPKMTDEELLNIQTTGGINVHNDYVQFLAEHGIVGFGCLVAIVVLLIMPLGRVWRALFNSVRFLPTRKQPAKPIAIFVLPAPAFCILMAAIATFVHSFGDCVMRSPAVLTLFFVELAAIDGFLPHVDIQAEHHSHRRSK